ncbi:MAG: hypothetical protein CL663_01725 [Bacteroidetes bacterium]|nr:hypothetical protein [Bacteroidota bacterium]
MGLYTLAKNRKFKNFMARLYGWGASVVIIGVLFKLVHWPNADYLLIVGLGVEALIFFFSAFETPYTDPDWSLVYPELYNSYHGTENGNKPTERATAKLDDMLTNANIDSQMIDHLGRGLERFSKHTEQLSDITNAAVASNDFAEQVSKIADSMASLNRLYEKQLVDSNQQVESTAQLHETINHFMRNLNDSTSQMVEYKNNMDQLNEKMAALNKVYENMLSAMNVNK